MAALNIQSYIDQENTSATGLKGRTAAGRSGVAGKTFQSNAQKTFVKPRRALGDVNSVHRIQPRGLKDVGKQNEPVLKKVLGTQLVNKPQCSGEKQQQAKENPMVKTAVLTTSSHDSFPEDIDTMTLQPDLPDTFEDILPMSERPSTRINDILDWKQDLFSFHHADFQDKKDTDFFEDFPITRKSMTDPSEGNQDSNLCVSKSELDSLDLPTLDFCGCEDLFLPML